MLLGCTASVLGLTWDKGKGVLALAKAALEEPLPEKKSWSTDLDWDTEVDEVVKAAFRYWHEELNLLQEL